MDKKIKPTTANVGPSLQTICGEKIEHSLQQVVSQHRPSGKLWSVLRHLGGGKNGGTELLVGQSNQLSICSRPMSDPVVKNDATKAIREANPALKLNRIMNCGNGHSINGIGDVPVPILQKGIL